MSIFAHKLPIVELLCRNINNAKTRQRRCLQEHSERDFNPDYVHLTFDMRAVAFPRRRRRLCSHSSVVGHNDDVGLTQFTARRAFRHTNGARRPAAAGCIETSWWRWRPLAYAPHSQPPHLVRYDAAAATHNSPTLTWRSPFSARNAGTDCVKWAFNM